MLSGAISAGANFANQRMNYDAEKKAQSGNSQNSMNVPKSSNGKTATECESFADYISWKEIGIAAVSTMVAAPLGIGASSLVMGAFPVTMTGGVNTAARVIANLATGGKVSILQSIVSLF